MDQWLTSRPSAVPPLIPSFQERLGSSDLAGWISFSLGKSLWCKQDHRLFPNEEASFLPSMHCFKGQVCFSYVKPCFLIIIWSYWWLKFTFWRKPLFPRMWGCCGGTEGLHRHLAAVFHKTSQLHVCRRETHRVVSHVHRRDVTNIMAQRDLHQLVLLQALRRKFTYRCDPLQEIGPEMNTQKSFGNHNSSFFVSAYLRTLLTKDYSKALMQPFWR